MEGRELFEEQDAVWGAGSRRRAGAMRCRRHPVDLPSLLVLGVLLACAVPGIGRVTRHVEDSAFFPLEMVLHNFEALVDGNSEAAASTDYLNHVAGSLALGGRFVHAERALATSLRLEPKQGDALYLLGALRCSASRLGEARDAMFKAYHSRAVSNAFEAAAINSDTCATIPLLYPGDAVSHERSYPVFPHYSHTERFYVVQRDPADEVRRTVAAPALANNCAQAQALDPNRESLPGEVHGDLEALDGAESMMARSVPVVRDARWERWGGETLLKQSSGDAALREGIALAALGYRVSCLGSGFRV